MNNVIVGKKITLFPFAESDIPYFDRLFVNGNRIQLPCFASIDDTNLLHGILKQMSKYPDNPGAFVATRKHGKALSKLGIVFLMKTGHTAAIRFIADEDMLNGLSKKLQEVRDWKKATEEEFNATPAADRRIKGIAKPGKKPYQLLLIRRKAGEEITDEEKTISGDIIDQACRYCFDRLNTVRIETLIPVGEHLRVRLMTQSGFQKEGILKKYTYINGTIHDMIIMSRIRNES